MHAISVGALWLHLVSTIGLFGVFFLVRFISTPVMTELARQEDRLAVPLLVQISSRIVVLAWVFIGVSGLSGVVQFFLSSNYHGLFVIEASNPWSLYMLVKHTLYAGLLASMIAYTLKVRRAREAVAKLAASGAKDQVIKPDVVGTMTFFALTNVLLTFGVIVCSSLTFLQRDGTVLFFFRLVHFLLVSAWLGGMSFVVFIGTPFIWSQIQSKQLTVYEGLHHQHLVAIRFIKALWTGIMGAIFTGFPMIFMDAQYAGFMRVGSASNTIMLVKIALFILMILGAFRVTPAIIRIGELLQQAESLPSLPKQLEERLLSLRLTVVHTSRFGLSFGTVVMLVTALAVAMRAA